MAVTTEVTEDGLLLEPNFHDGYLTGILLEAGTATLVLQTVDLKRYVVTLEKVTSLAADCVREGNIVASVHLLTGAYPSERVFELDRIFEPPHPKVPKEVKDRWAADKAAQLDQVASGD